MSLVQVGISEVIGSQDDRSVLGESTHDLSTHVIAVRIADDTQTNLAQMLNDFVREGVTATDA